MAKITYFKYVDVPCFHCKKELRQRNDTHQRQQTKYGHSCCKHCFGKEQTFRDARSRVMNENNPFKGKTHSRETRSVLSKKKMGVDAWNKGLNKDTHPSVAKYGRAVSITKLKNPPTGAKNPNWKGGRKPFRYPSEHARRWNNFRIGIKERDGYKCRKCGTSKRLDVHHMASRKRHPELEFNSNNCVTLCRQCHIAFHKKYGRKNFVYNNTMEWLAIPLCLPTH